MEKASSAFMNNLRYVCLIFVVTFGLITIIGSGGGGSGGDDYVHYCNPSQIYFTYPEDNETDAVGYRLIFVRFTELMDDSTINQSTFTLEDNTGNLVGGSVRFSEYLRCGILGCYPFAHAFFYPSSNLLPSTRYTATLDSTVQDEEGNALGCNYSWRFTTKPDGVGIWQAVSTMNAPSKRYGHTAIWTGTEMIVWGGFYGGYLNTGGRYNPITDTWQAISTTNAPGSRFRHTAIWTGTEMVVWGGYIGPSTYLDTGGRYDPSSNSWEETSTIGAPEGRDKHTAVWTGTEMIVWGGYIYPDTYLDTGGRYDPSSNSWEETSTIGAPEGRDKHTAVWTGTEMIVWGGYTVLERFGESYIVYSIHTGGVYYPDTNIWQETSTTNTPLGMSEHAAVWTGGEMIVWSGTGGRYIP